MTFLYNDEEHSYDEVDVIYTIYHCTCTYRLCVYVCIYVMYGGEGVGGVYVTGLGSFLPFSLFLYTIC